MESMITENGVTFKELEKNIYAWVCQLGQQFTKEFLERYDQMLMQEREKDKYRHKGVRQTTVVIRQIKRCLLRQIKTGFTEHLTMV